MNGGVYVYLLSFGLSHVYVSSSTMRPADYVAPVNPCRHEDRLCSTKCVVMQMSGDISCDFCVCTDRDYYVKLDTTLDPTLTSQLPTTLPPGVFEVNGIRYITVQDPCDRVRDHVCPSKCARQASVKQDGTPCTECDCKGQAVLLGK